MSQTIPKDVLLHNCLASINMIKATNEAQEVTATTINQQSSILISSFLRVQVILDGYVTEMKKYTGKDDGGYMSVVQGEYQAEQKRQENWTDQAQSAMKSVNTMESALGDDAQQCSQAFTTVMGLLKLLPNLLTGL